MRSFLINGIVFAFKEELVLLNIYNSIVCACTQYNNNNVLNNNNLLNRITLFVHVLNDIIFPKEIILNRTKENQNIIKRINFKDKSK